MAVYDINDTAALLKTRLARFTTDSTFTGYIVAELVQAQQRLEQNAFKPWFLKTLVTNFAIGATESTAAPTGFLGVVDETKFYLTNSDSETVVLPSRFYDDALDEYPLATDAAQPIVYSVQADSKFYFFPTPDVTTYTGRFWYYKADTVPAADGAANLWTTNARDLLVAEAGLYMAKMYLKDDKAADVFAGIIKLETIRLQQLTAWKDIVNNSATPED